MTSVYLECEPGEIEALIGELYERGTTGILELGSGVRAWFDSDVDLSDLIERYDGEIIPEDTEDWVRRTEESFPPLPIGERLWLVPPWYKGPPPPGRMRLEINPGLACGTGWHECTQMCLELLEERLRPGDSVLDVGTGSGILSVAADLLGAGGVLACDLDADTVAIARERIGGRVFRGTADAVRSAIFDIVIANISRPVIEAILPDLRRACRDKGTLILSGFQTLPELGDVLEIRERWGWCAAAARAVTRS